MEIHDIVVERELTLLGAVIKDEGETRKSTTNLAAGVIHESARVSRHIHGDEVASVLPTSVRLDRRGLVDNPFLCVGSQG